MHEERRNEKQQLQLRHTNTLNIRHHKQQHYM